MRFAHLADVHIGAWRDPAMKQLSVLAFKRAIDSAIEKKLDFVLISGDLFNNALPAIDHLQQAVVLLKKLKNNNITTYVVLGSHDSNAGGRTIIDVLEEADLLINVMKGEVVDGKLKLKFTEDEKTGAKITGMGGRRGSLEKKEYSSLDTHLLEKEQSFKIFMFHSAIDELKPKELDKMDSMSAKELPKGFDYYAGGHVHIVEKKDVDGRKNLVYPGPTFPASFSELWKLEHGGFYLYDDGKITFQDIKIKSIEKLELDCEGRSAEDANKALVAFTKAGDFATKIVMIRAYGKLANGKPGDIDFKSAFSELYHKDAFFIMRNTSQLSSEEFVEMNIHSGNADELEDEMIKEHLKSTNRGFSEKEAMLIKSLIKAFSDEQKDGEKKYEYEERMRKEGNRTFER